MTPCTAPSPRITHTARTAAILFPPRPQRPRTAGKPRPRSYYIRRAGGAAANRAARRAPPGQSRRGEAGAAGTSGGARGGSRGRSLAAEGAAGAGAGAGKSESERGRRCSRHRSQPCPRPCRGAERRRCFPAVLRPRWVGCSALARELCLENCGCFTHQTRTKDLSHGSGGTAEADIYLLDNTESGAKNLIHINTWDCSLTLERRWEESQAELVIWEEPWQWEINSLERQRCCAWRAGSVTCEETPLCLWHNSSACSIRRGNSSALQVALG